MGKMEHLSQTVADFGKSPFVLGGGITAFRRRRVRRIPHETTEFCRNPFVRFSLSFFRCQYRERAQLAGHLRTGNSAA